MEGFLTTTVEALVERARKEKRVHPLFSASEKAEVSARISEAVHDSQEKVGEILVASAAEMKESEVCGMFQKLAAIERGILDKRFRRRCVKAGHCAECKKQKMHYCCKCDAEIKNDCPGYLSHIDEKHLIRQLVQE